MLAKRIIPCLDVKDGRVVKGVQFRNHKDMGDIGELAQRYENADEFVFYDITASTKDSTVEKQWIDQIAKNLRIPFCVAGGINSVDKAREILYRGADKISINTPALMNPSLVSKIAQEFGSQAVVVGIDSRIINDEYRVYSHTGDENTTRQSSYGTLEWAKQVQSLGAGEIVLNCISEDGRRQGYDLEQLVLVASAVNIPVVASGGAGCLQHFLDVFEKTPVTGALAASVFHSGELTIQQVRDYLASHGVPMRRAV